jgi:hypothetical protein
MSLSKDQGALNHRRETVGEGLCRHHVSTGGSGQIAIMITTALPVRGGGLVNRVVWIRELGRRVHEHAPVEVRIIEPEIHDVQRGQELSGRIIAGQLPHRAVPGLRFPFISPKHRGDHQVVLALEVLVESRLGHARLCDDLIDADSAKPVSVEKAQRPPPRVVRDPSWAHPGGREALRPTRAALGNRRR